ncbi:DUF5995 family protein [Aquimarina litoralis]|uniref:DUF5995 family protein n=1 Tax=Aquimarina litoralis TaxID=584605 RepID=UPI001C582AD5|nr:DUF5995 family protein [Aquimarina litoralis]MBW1297618.1 hypothetical protein [Aquimarina litoralis]
MKPITTIEDVITSLDDIIATSKEENNPLGYFAALYRRVTIRVKEGIEEDLFEDGERMETLDVVFAKRYIDAYTVYQKSKPVTDSWKIAFDVSEKYWPIVIQHLLVGINAHINLDLGIAAAKISQGKNIDDLKGDFDKINEILASLVTEVENDLAEIWPTFRKMLKRLGNVDNFLINFSMELARDGAWQFAKDLANSSNDTFDTMISDRDQKVTDKAFIITNPGWKIRIVLGIMRIAERGSVSDKIHKLIS